MVSEVLGVLGLTAAVAFGAMTLLWLLSLALRDASIVDSWWGPGFAAVALAAYVAGDGAAGRSLLALVLTAVWGLRLGTHILTRNLGSGEDPRYRAMRRRHGDAFPRVSLVTVFWLQGALMWIVSLPVQAAMIATTPASLTPLDWAGAAVWLLGFGFEAIGDEQLRRFKADPANAGTVMTTGLWRYTRHPNYFGDAALWWGLFLIGAATPWGPATVVGPIVMTTLLRRVSGVPLTEKRLAATRPGYAEYARRTSPFLPLPPKRR